MNGAFISSRTPEGEPARCPVCKQDARIEPSIFFGDATCPHCGTLLWILQLSGEQIVFEQTSSVHLRDRVRQALARVLNVTPDKLEEPLRLVDVDGDSLDMAEWAMELDQEYEIR